MDKKLLIISWNILLGRPFVRVLHFLRKHTPDIICLQEMPISERKIKNLNKLGGYSFAMSDRAMVHKEKGNAITNVILSKYKIEKTGDLSFPETDHRRMPGLSKWHERTLAFWVDVKTDEQLLRIYNCHMRVTGVGPKERLADVKVVLEHARDFSGPVIICGDMNTVLPERSLYRIFIKWFNRAPEESFFVNGQRFDRDERYLFKETVEAEGFRDTLPIDQATWAFPATSIELFKFKLDWLLVKNISHTSASLGPYISDHRPVLAEVEI